MILLKRSQRLEKLCRRQTRGRLDDFDITYSTKHEEIHTPSQEGLAMDLKLAVIYRPVKEELYQLDSEIGPNVTLETGCVVRNSTLRDCILGQGVRIEDSRLHDSLVGDYAVIRGIRGSVSVAAHSLLEGDA